MRSKPSESTRVCACGNATVREDSRCELCASLVILGLEPGASDPEITSAYNMLANVWNPDRFKADARIKAEAEEKLQEINKAYRTLQECPPDKRPRRRSRSWPGAEAQDPRSAQPAAEPAKSPRLRRIPVPSPAILILFAVLAGIAAATWLLFKPVSGFPSPNPAAGKSDAQTRTEAVGTLRALRDGIWDNAVRSVHEVFGGIAASSTADASTTNPKATGKKPAKRQQDSADQPGVSGPTVHLLPYITADLTQQEVESIAGPPDSASTEKLVYGGSELTFANGKLAGWRIEPGSQLHVKLWPDAAVDPDLQSFTVGSSKNEVLVVQGTPTYWSENTFGYGASEVYFENGHVVRWKEDPGSVRLHAVVH